MTVRQSFTVGMDVAGGTSQSDTMEGLVRTLAGAGYQGVAAEPRPGEVSAIISRVIIAKEQAPAHGAQWYALGRALTALREAEEHGRHGE